MSSLLNSIRYFSAEPAVRNLYKNQDFDYRKERNKIADERYNQQFAQQQEDRAFNRSRALRQDKRADQMFNLQMSKHNQQQQLLKEQKIKDKVAAVVFASKTPDAWRRNIQRLREKGINIGPEYDDFSQRESVLAEYGSLDHVMAMNKNQIERQKADGANPAYLNGFKDKKQKLGAEENFRKEFTKISGDFVKVRDAQGRIEASAQDPSAAGDLALIFNYMKVLDPGSTVREGEFATAQNSAGVNAAIRAKWNSMLNGERLAPEQRLDFLNRSRMLYKRQEQQYNKTRTIYEGIAKRVGLDVKNVLPDLSIYSQDGQQKQVNHTRSAINPKTGERILIDTRTGQIVR